MRQQPRFQGMRQVGQMPCLEKYLAEQRHAAFSLNCIRDFAQTAQTVKSLFLEMSTTFVEYEQG